jgi:hypothetical protein
VVVWAAAGVPHTSSNALATIPVISLIDMRNIRVSLCERPNPPVVPPALGRVEAP